LMSFYDDVLLPALRLAENDRHQGTLAEVRQRFIFTSCRELIEELERRSAQDTATGDSSVPTPTAIDVWCLPASDDADELVGLMARHLLTSRGFATTVASVSSSPDTLTNGISVDRAAVAFVAALPPSAIGSARRACLRV